MKTDFPAAHLRCPACGRDRTLRLAAEDSDEREVREGALICGVCGAVQAVHRGVAELMGRPPAHVEREAAGLERFAEVMRNDGWTPERIRSLPDIDDGYWYVQGKSIRQLWDTIDFAPGQWLLDLGSNTCWASNFFASRDLNVIALDISLWEMQGLWSADFFIENGTSYFERVLASMNDLPIASDSLDYVYACEVLHHNDPQGLLCTFEEAYRVLKPGGRMLVINETLKTWHDPVGVHVDAVAQFEGYEHAHWAFQYRTAAMRAGFATKLIEPSYHGFYRQPPAATPPPLRSWAARLQHELQRRAWGRRAFLMWSNHIAGGVAFGMIATKPSRPSTSPHSVAPRLRDLLRRAVRSG